MTEIETNSNNIIIGNLLSVADLTSKTVILSTIVTKFLLPKFELSTLEQCVYFINIAVIVKDSEHNALFSNKATLADRIILEIYELFPARRENSDSMYTNRKRVQLKRNITVR